MVKLANNNSAFICLNILYINTFFYSADISEKQMQPKGKLSFSEWFFVVVSKPIA